MKLLGDIYREEGDIEKALKYYIMAYKRSPESEELKKILSELNYQENAEELAFKEVDDKYAIDADLDKIIDDIFQNVNVEKNEEAVSKDGDSMFALEDSLNMINQLSEKTKVLIS